MLILGHLGISTGISWLIGRSVKLIEVEKQKVIQGKIPETTGACIVTPIHKVKKKRLIVDWSNNIDIRFVFIGAMLPDIIDKPLGMFIFREELSSARIFSHTLIFQMALLLVALVSLLQFKKYWVFTISLNSILHLVLDRMWQQRNVLFWPMYREGFTRENVDAWSEYIIHKAIFKPYAYINEIIGFVILIVFLFTMYKRFKNGGTTGLFLL